MNSFHRAPRCARLPRLLWLAAWWLPGVVFAGPEPAPPLRTSNPVYTLGGVTEPGAAVELVLNGQPHSKLQTGPKGKFSFDDLRLREGLNTLVVTVTDLAGNATTGTRRVFVDSKAPPWELTFPPRRWRTKEHVQVITGLSEPGAQATLRVDGNVFSESTIAQHGRYHVGVTDLDYGDHRLLLTIRDELGNASHESWLITVKPPSPLTVRRSWQGTRTRERHLILTGTAELGAGVTLFDNGALREWVWLRHGADFQFDLGEVSYGRHDFLVVATDDVGNETSEELSVFVKAAPGLTVDRTWEGRLTASRNLVFRGQAEPEATVALFDNDTLLEKQTVGTEGRFEFTAEQLADGPHVMRFVATDDVGNVVEESLTVTVKPPPPLTIPTDWDPLVLVDPEVALEGRSEHGAQVSLVDNGRQVATLPAAPDGSFRFKLVDLAEGEHALEVIAVDIVGNRVSKTARLRVSRPVALTAPPPELLTRVNRVQVAGEALPGVPVRLLLNGEPVAEQMAAPSGVFDFGEVRLAEGRNVLTVHVFPGDKVCQTVTQTVEVDSQPPAVEVLSPTGPTRTRQVTANVTVRSEPGAQVTLLVFNKPVVTATMPPSGEYTFTDAPLPRGANGFTIRSQDAAGNVSTTECWVWKGFSSGDSDPR